MDVPDNAVVVHDALAETDASNEAQLITILAASAGAVVAYLIVTYLDHRSAARGLSVYRDHVSLEELGYMFVAAASYIGLFLGVGGSIVMLGRQISQQPASTGQLLVLLAGSALLGSLVLWVHQFGRHILMAGAIGSVAVTELLFAAGGLLGLHDLGILDTGLWAYVGGIGLALLAGLVFLAWATIRELRGARQRDTGPRRRSACGAGRGRDGVDPDSSSQ